MFCYIHEYEFSVVGIEALYIQVAEICIDNNICCYLKHDQVEVAYICSLPGKYYGVNYLTESHNLLKRSFHLANKLMLKIQKET